MSQANDQMIEWNKAVMQAAIRFAGIVLEGTEHMLQVQMKAVKGAVADGTQRAKALAEAESPQEFGQLKGALAQPDLEKAADYFKSVYEVAAHESCRIEWKSSHNICFGTELPEDRIGVHRATAL